MSDINAILDRHGIKRCGDSSCIFGPRGGMMTNGGCRCGHDDPGAPSRPTRLSRQLAHAVTEQAAEVARLTAELAAARAVPDEVEVVLEKMERAAAVLGPKRAAKPSAKWLAFLAASDEATTAIARAISDATAARGTVGGLLAAGEERESRAWSEKGKAPPGSCPFCASRISMVQRDGYFIARCSHRGCGAVGPRMRSVSRAADLFCQPPRREAQGMSCGPIVDWRARAIAAEIRAEEAEAHGAGSDALIDAICQRVGARDTGCGGQTVEAGEMRRRMNMTQRIDMLTSAAAQWAKVAPLIERLRHTRRHTKPEFVVAAIDALLAATEATP